MKVVAAAIFNHLGEVLICQKSEGSILAGLWEFPGGKVKPEDGEHPRLAMPVALKREIFEELNLRIRVQNDFFAVSSGRIDGRDIELFGFKAQIDSGTLILREHSDARWLQPNVIEMNQMGPLDQPLLKALILS